MTIHMRDAHCGRDDLIEVMERLKAVTNGVPAKELTLRRNIMGQLGFHVQPDGIVTLVESAGQAWQAGLRQNSRLVEICKVAVSTLTYDQMVDLLKTSICVTLSVIPPLADGSPRKGCTLQNCKYNEGNYEGDYENGGSSEESKHRKAPHGQRAVPGNHRIYDRSFSPPRSSNSSGYGTGSSSKSFLGTDSRFPVNSEGTITSSSSGQSVNEIFTETIDRQLGIPPPLPNKGAGYSSRGNHSNTHPSTPKRNNIHQISQLQVSQSHNHFGVQNAQHNKVQVSHSLPLQHVNYSIPLTASKHNSADFYKLDKNNLLKQQNDHLRGESDYAVTRAPKVDYASIQLSNDGARSDDYSTETSISDRVIGISSEDELSIGGNISPRCRTAKHLATIPISNSRNHSPRLTNGEAKLRPGVTARSSNRNSANISNNFQEELMRLINPDNIESNEANMNREHNRDNLNVHKSQPEVILTTARPATVISNASTTSSPLPSEFKGSTNGRISPPISSPSKSVPIGSEDIPLPEDMDWSSLVDTATRAMLQLPRNVDPNIENDIDRNNRWDSNGMDASISSS